MLIILAATILVVIGIFVIPAIGNIETPLNLSDWYFGNFFKAALIVGVIIIGTLWLLFLLF